MPTPWIDELLAHLPEALASDGGGWSDVVPTELAERLAGDPEARALWDRWLEQARALRALSRVEVPFDLEGRVVAALHGGHRQDRAVERVRSLPRLDVPEALDVRVRHMAERPFGLSRRAAPSVLDRLVEEEFDEARPAGARGQADGPRPKDGSRPGVVRRLVERLDRSQGSSATSSRGRRELRRSGPLLAVALGLAVAGLGWSLLERGTTRAAEPPVLEFEFVGVDADSEDAARAASLLYGLAGGKAR